MTCPREEVSDSSRGALASTVISELVGPNSSWKLISARSCTRRSNGWLLLRAEALFGDRNLVAPGTQCGLLGKKATGIVFLRIGHAFSPLPYKMFPMHRPTKSRAEGRRAGHRYLFALA
jgi:hypothetical protein